jgi:hypothetical protein
MKNGEPKYILKKSLEQILPHDILYRKKMGFCVPLREWAGGMMTDYVETNLEEFCNHTGLFNEAGLKANPSKNQAGQCQHDQRSLDPLLFNGLVQKMVECMKVLLVTNIPNPYRLALFNELNSQMKAAAYELKIIFGSAGYKRRQFQLNLAEAEFHYEVLHSHKITLGTGRKPWLPIKD